MWTQHKEERTHQLRVGTVVIAQEAEVLSSQPHVDSMASAVGALPQVGGPGEPLLCHGRWVICTKLPMRRTR